jgi:hypothetical protein
MRVVYNREWRRMTEPAGNFKLTKKVAYIKD